MRVPAMIASKNAFSASSSSSAVWLRRVRRACVAPSITSSVGKVSGTRLRPTSPDSERRKICMYFSLSLCGSEISERRNAETTFFWPFT